MAAVSTRAKALVGVLFAVLWLTPDAVLVRLIKTVDGVTQLFWQHLFMGTALTLGYVAIYCFGIDKRFGTTTSSAGAASTTCVARVGTALRAIRDGSRTRWALIQAGLFCVTNFCFLFSLERTAAATTLVFIGASPLWSAVLSRVFLKEPIHASTAAALVFGSIGVGIVFYGSFVDDGDGLTEEAEGAVGPPQTVGGALLGLAAGVSLAFYLVSCRYAADSVPSHSEVAALIVAGPLGMLASLALGARPWVANTTGAAMGAGNDDWLWMVLRGAGVAPISFAGMAVGPRYILAAEVSLIQLLESIVGPLWVWVAGYEAPPLFTLIGGAELLTTLFAYFWWTLRVEREEAAEAAADREEAADDGGAKRQTAAAAVVDVSDVAVI